MPVSPYITPGLPPPPLIPAPADPVEVAQYELLLRQQAESEARARAAAAAEGVPYEPPTED